MSCGLAEGKAGFKSTVYWICIVASLGGLLFGLDQGFIANALPTIDMVYALNLSQGESYSGILAWGAIIGALLSGFFARYLGRKKSLVFAGFLFTVMSIVSALLPAMPILSACRFILGFAVGVASFVVPLYLAETAPAKIRGAMGTLFQLMITIGIFAISVSNVFLVQFVADEWTRLPLMFSLIALFAFVMFLGAIYIPESPRWLMLKNRKEEANAVLLRVLNTQEEVDIELKEIQDAICNSPSGLSGIFKSGFFKVLFVGILMMMFQQLVGINMMIYYAPTIFGYAAITGLLGMMTVPTVNMLFTFPAIWLVEKWGRKKLLYIGAVMMGITMLAAGLVFNSTAKYESPVDKALTQYIQADMVQRVKIISSLKSGLVYRYPAVVTILEDNGFQGKVKNYLSAKGIGSDTYKIEENFFDTHTQTAKFKDLGSLIPDASKVVLLVSIIVYIFGFAFSWGPIAWLICSEFFPLAGREIGMTVTTMVNWLFAGIVMTYSLSFMKAHGNASIFFVFSGGCLLSIIFLVMFVPETKGVTLEEIEKNLKNGKKLRNLGVID